MARSLDAHDFISFRDPDDDRIWFFDATFLRSSWTCIFGRGCLGIYTTPTPEMSQGCCSMGAWFTDEEDLAKVEAHAARLNDENWQFRKKAGEKIWRQRGADKTSRLVQDACIFLNRPDFAAGAGCALHLGALQAGERPLDWKPNVCWQLPLRLEEDTDDSGQVTSVLREWKRRDWGDGGDEFAWWCTDSPLAFIGGEPVYRSLRAEIVEMIGQKIYGLLVEHLEAPQPLPHPALRQNGSRPPRR
ncbi:MAG TPA: hypothetical protein VJQ57_00150 [Acidimicrobiia bacterium]|nr:hypothetical protein [Acidimicrobiia bacterium]